MAESLPGSTAPYFNSPAEANNAYLTYIAAAQRHLRCPAKYTNAGPSPYSYNGARDINGVRDTWGSDVVIPNVNPDNSCADTPPAWRVLARLVPVCPKGVQVTLEYVTYPTHLQAYCAIYFPDEQPCEACTVGNPVYVSHGEKLQVERDYSGPTGLEFTRTYRNRHGRFIAGQDRRLFDLSGASTPDGCLPAVYVHPSHNGGPSEERPDCFRYKAIGVQQYHLLDSNGASLVFSGSPSAPTAPSFSRDRLVQFADAQGLLWWHAFRENNVLEIFSASGRLVRQVSPNGQGVSVALVAPGVEAWADSFGRSLILQRSNLGEIAFVTDPAGGVYAYEYDANRSLVRVAYPRGAEMTPSSRQYHYESSYWPSGGNAIPIWQLTGISDELGRRFSTYVYGASNRVMAERHHAGEGGDVNVYRFAYSGGTSTLTDPLGAVRTYGFTSLQGKRTVLSTVSQPAGAGSGAANASFQYDSQANLVSRDDFAQVRSCRANDLSRNLETVRVIGLAPTTNCLPVTVTNAALPAGSRKTSTQWHPDWRVETKVAEPGRIVTSIYNGQPDPFNGNAIASCAPASALLPDGKPIAVLCKRVEQATTDTNGAAGFAATLQNGVANRVSTWTYNQWGQVLSENGPRTDVNDTTTYTYYSDTSFTGEGAAAEGHFMGDLESVTNAAGKITRYTKYNKHGQVLESVDPNGVVTVNTYDLRQRLLSTSTAGQTTSYQYDLAGQLKRVTLPDQSWVGYDYDDAHRQVAVYDHKGNRIDYTLDNAGNRIGEQTKDPSGALKGQLSRSIDALGRVQQTAGKG